jgi:hypothetical protein
MSIDQIVTNPRPSDGGLVIWARRNQPATTNENCLFMNDVAKNLSAETAYVAIHYVTELQQKKPNGVVRVRATYISSRWNVLKQYFPDLQRNFLYDRVGSTHVV